MNKLLVLMVLLTIAGCGNRAAYENMRIHQRNECLKEPPLRYEESAEPANKSYDEYQREREKALDEQSEDPREEPSY